MAQFFRGALYRFIQPTHVVRKCTFMTTAKRMIATDLVFPTNFQKKILVWTRFYPNVESVPRSVSFARMKKAIDLFRIRVNIMMMVFAVGACIAAAVHGKHLKASGDSMSKRGQDQIRIWQEAKKAERAKAEK